MKLAGLFMTLSAIDCQLTVLSMHTTGVMLMNCAQVLVSSPLYMLLTFSKGVQLTFQGSKLHCFHTRKKLTP